MRCRLPGPGRAGNEPQVGDTDQNGSVVCWLSATQREKASRSSSPLATANTTASASSIVAVNSTLFSTRFNPLAGGSGQTVSWHRLQLSLGGDGVRPACCYYAQRVVPGAPLLRPCWPAWGLANARGAGPWHSPARGCDHPRCQPGRRDRLPRAAGSAQGHPPQRPPEADSGVRRRVQVRTFKGWDHHKQPGWLEIGLVATDNRFAEP